MLILKISPFSSDKHLKDLLSKLLGSGYFENIPAPVPEKEELKEEMPRRPERTRQLSKPESVKEPGSLNSTIKSTMADFSVTESHVPLTSSILQFPPTKSLLVLNTFQTFLLEIFGRQPKC